MVVSRYIGVLMRKSLTIIFLLAVMFPTWSQKVFTPKYTWNVELGLPIEASNVAFRDYMQGLVSVTTYQQYSFPFHLNIGAGVKYSYFTADQFSIQADVSGGIHSAGAFLKVGYDKFHGERFATDFGVKVGYAEHFFATNLNKASGLGTPYRGSSYVEPTLGLILTADERNSYRFNIGYTIFGFNFQPVDLGLETNGAFPENKLANITQYLFVGFGYTFYFGVKAQGE